MDGLLTEEVLAGHAQDMSVRLFYVDESHDDDRFCLCAISIVHRDWKDCFATVKQHRAVLKQTHGLFMRAEIHARELVKGKGQISLAVISRHDRCRIYEGLLNLVASLPNVKLFNVCLDKKAHKDPELVAWDRLLNRIERYLFKLEQKEVLMRKKLAEEIENKIPAEMFAEASLRINTYKPRGIVFADEGNEVGITRAFRKMNVFNPIPSMRGAWASGEKSRNMPLQRVIEDPVFKKSHQSYFIQLADCVAFALLKREVSPTPNVLKHDIHKMFDRCLASVCHKPASKQDSLGIVRK